MGVITEHQVRHYYGLAADMASVVAACRCVGDIYFQTDTKAAYIWDGAAWKGPVPPDWITPAMLKTDSVETLKIKNLNVTAAKAALGFGRFVPRSPNVADFTTLAFTTDATWKVNGLDLSGIVTAGAVGVVLRVTIQDDAANSQFQIRQSAAASVTEILLLTQVVNIYIAQIAVLPIDADRLLDYQGSNLAFAFISVSVLGWFI
ncbi:MAG: hypothetical protein KAX16_07305 [Actinomycetia bacterium]|nr:hypothetical protein [Actinomycetes bacterium]